MRAKGEGSVYYDEKAERWRGQLDLGTDGTGKRRRVKVTGRTRKEAADKLKAKRAEQEAGTLITSSMTVAALVEKWLATVTPTMSDRNAAYVKWTAGYSAELLGAMKLSDLRIGHVEDALAKLPDEGLNRTSITRVRSTLSRILDWGQDRDLVARNAAKRAELPKARGAAKGRSLTAEELSRLLDVLNGTRLEALWWTMAGCGLRPAEATGLRWDDIDFDTATLHVTQALKWTDGNPRLGDLKTARSRRSLGIPAPVVATLKAHRVQTLNERMALRWPDEWKDLVFLSEDGTPVDRSNLRRVLNRAVDEAGIGHVRLYDLRHTCASLMADAGVRLEDVADYLGHEGTDMARHVYVHRLTDRVDAAVRPLGKAMGE